MTRREFIRILILSIVVATVRPAKSAEIGPRDNYFPMGFPMRFPDADDRFYIPIIKR